MEPESNREATSPTPEWPAQATPVLADLQFDLDREQITTPLQPSLPHQDQQLAQQLAQQREQQLEQQLSQVRAELAAMEGLMQEVSEIFELKYQQRLQHILAANNNLRQQLDQLHRQLQQLQPRHQQAQPYQLQPPQQAGNQPLLTQLERPRRQRRQLKPARSTAARTDATNTKTAIINIANAKGDNSSAINSNNRNQVIAIPGWPQRIGLTRNLRLRSLAAALLHALGWRRRVENSAAAPGPRP
jgi:vacuolar-type H+-ATPase subunit I/STV1